MTPLDEPRARIDRIDRALVRLLARRMAVSREIGDRKATLDPLRVRDPRREATVLATWTAHGAEHGLAPEFVARVLEAVLDHSREVQVERDRPRVAFQGTVGAWGELAIEQAFGVGRARPVGRATFEEVVTALAGGAVEQAVLPVRNRLVGKVPGVAALLARSDVRVVGRVEVAVRHALLGVPGSSIADLRTVRSHPVALAQCEGFLRGLDGVTTESDWDTAGAASRVAQGGDPAVAAIAGERCAARYGLEVLARDLTGDRRNLTEFVVLEPRTRTGHRLS